jgi:hypothetical protein
MSKPLHSRRAGLFAGALLLSAALAPPLAATTLEFEFDADTFDTPLGIDNQFWPQVLGTNFTYKAETPDGCEWSVVTVTDGTKDISVPGQDTITVRVVSDFEYEDEDCGGIVDEELAEKTFDWYGQDDFDNIWYFGEDSRECAGEGNCDAEPGEGSWEAGVDDALPGIIMLGDPDSGERYRQEFAEEVALDWGMVMNLNGQPVLKLEDAVEPGEWDDCLVIKEWNELEPGEVEQKTYCPDAGGLVLVEEHSGKLVRFELVEPVADAAGTDAFTFRTVPKN